jgi:Protein of unknown function (DUF3037)
MAHSYSFAIIRLAPSDFRGERLNIGAIVLSERGIDVRLTRNIEKVKSISAALDYAVLNKIVQNITKMDEQFRQDGMRTFQSRIEMLKNLEPLALSEAGSFVANGAFEYENRILSIMNMLVEPEPAPRRQRDKRTRLFSQVKKGLKAERVLARRDEGLESHRVVSGYELASGLVADLMLQNGSYHVVETVDLSGDEHVVRRAISEIAISALVIERARMKFGPSQTRSQLVYVASSVLEKLAMPSLDAAQHQGTKLVNWASDDDRRIFLQGLSSLATPIEENKKGRFVVPIGGQMLH